MEHVKDIELIELAAGRLGSERDRDLRVHLGQCSECRRKLKQIKQTWDMLGAWQVRSGRQYDVMEHIAAGKPDDRADGPSIIRPSDGRPAFRLAATIAVTALVGYGSGRLVAHRMPHAEAIEPPQYVSALGLDVGDSLSSLVLQDEPSLAEEG